MAAAAAFTIRALNADDLALEREFVDALSEQDLRSRTLGGSQHPTDRQLRYLLRTRQGHLGLAAFSVAEPKIIGVARFGPMQDPAVAQFAVVVAAHARRHGLARQLIQRLIEAAAQAGYQQLEGETFADNAPMLALARKMGFDVGAVPDDPQLRRLTKRLAG